MPDFMNGKKTYIIGWLLVLKGIAGFLLPDVWISEDPAGDISMGLVALGLRKAIN